MNCWSYPDHIKQCKNEGKIFKTLVWEKKHNLCFFNICSQVFCVVVLDESFSIRCLVCCVAMLLCCCVAILLDDLWTWYWVLTYNLFFFFHGLQCQWMAVTWLWMDAVKHWKSTCTLRRSSTRMRTHGPPVWKTYSPYSWTVVNRDLYQTCFSSKKSFILKNLNVYIP